MGGDTDETRMADFFEYLVMLGEGDIRIHYTILLTFYMLEIFPNK